jgi:transcriptional regulator with XRE-family HTH domain
LNAVQSKMARAALGLGVRDLAELAKVSPDTIARLERGEELRERTVDAIRSALEAAGVEFTNGDQPGVRLRKAPRHLEKDR